MKFLRTASAICIVLGVGFGIGTALTIGHLERNGDLPMTPFGFRSLAGGQFERLGQETFAKLGWALVGVCVLDVIAGVWLWQGRRRGAWLAVATSPFALILGVGFALPFLLVAVPVRAALIFAGRGSLR